MRPIYVSAGVLVLGLGVAGWAALGQAQPGPALPGVKPAKDQRPSTRQGPAPPLPGELLAQPLPPPPAPPPAEKPIKKSDPVRMPDSGPELMTPDIKAPASGWPEVRPPIASPDPKPAMVIPAGNREPEPKPAVQSAVARQDPSVSLEWFGPTGVKAGTAAEYTLVARNTSSIPLYEVVVQVRVPTGGQVEWTEPKATGTEGVVLWDLGTLPPREEKPIKMRFLPPGKGDFTCQAWVTFTGSSSLKVQVREPRLSVKVQAPDKLSVGDAANVVLAVSNPGDHPADGVKLAVCLGEGLESAKGDKVTFDLSTLAAGETRQVTIPCVARAAGAQKCEAAAEGADGLKAADAGTITVNQPRLDLEISGPRVRYLDRKAVFAFKVTNPGDAP